MSKKETADIMIIKIPLSDSSTRAACVAGDVVLFAVSALILSTQSSAANIFFYAVLCAALLLALVFYTILVFSASISVNTIDKTITQNMLLHRETNDASTAARICTREVKLLQNEQRVISVCKADGTELFYISAMFSANNGIRCEAPAKTLAAALDITFIPAADVPLYDKKAKKEAPKHDAQITRSVWKDRKQHCTTIHAQPDPGTVIPPQDAGHDHSDNIKEDVNYDELDDRKTGTSKSN